MARRLPAPYDGLPPSAVDGWALWSLRAELGLADVLFAEVPPPSATDAWDPSELVHTTAFTSGPTTLGLPRHDGGDVDWYSVSADAPVPAPAAAPEPVTLVPGRLRYPGAPHPRWWQIENVRVDVGGFPPDRGHLATMLLIDLVVSHADDWFSVPVETTVGSVVTIRSFVVTDAFDLESTLDPPSSWTMFRVAGLDPSSLVVWPTAVTPLRSPVADEVVVGIDEDANLLWAVERRADGRELAPPMEAFVPDVPTGEVLATAPVDTTTGRAPGCPGSGTPTRSPRSTAAAASCRVGWPTSSSGRRRCGRPRRLRCCETPPRAPATRSTSSSRRPSPRPACAWSGAGCWPGAPTDDPCCGPSAKGCRC